MTRQGIWRAISHISVVQAMTLYSWMPASIQDIDLMKKWATETSYEVHIGGRDNCCLNIFTMHISRKEWSWSPIVGFVHACWNHITPIEASSDSASQTIKVCIVLMLIIALLVLPFTCCICAWHWCSQNQGFDYMHVQISQCLSRAVEGRQAQEDQDWRCNSLQPPMQTRRVRNSARINPCSNFHDWSWDVARLCRS